jgi:light-regulated signal transduction histidine kinase (bacteriophytochrome)
MGRLVDAAWLEAVPDPKARQKVEFSAVGLPAAVGDEALLLQVWINLLSNAQKFSSRSPSPRIEVLGEMRDGSHVYSVRDNGVGFEMKYAEKLFGVFERLHSPREFEGTGVGLALVKRIVARHGGRVAASGEAGRGATITFSLPPAEEVLRQAGRTPSGAQGPAGAS